MNVKELRRRIRLRTAEFLPGLLRVLPESWGREACGGIGLAGYLLVGRDRRLARGNFSRVHPEWSRGRVEGETRRVFRELGKNVYDFLRYPELDAAARARLVRIPDRTYLDLPRAEGTGAILVTAHLGCWEILAATLVGEGFPLRAMARPMRERRLEQALRDHRRRMGVETIPSEGTARKAVRHLAAGGYLGMLADQRVKQGGEWVTFLGQPTRMADGPARLALAAGVPVIPFGIRRLPDHTHRVEVLPPIRPSAGRSARDLTGEIAGALSELIRLAPREWMWIHPRWEAPRAPAPPPEPGIRAETEGQCARP